MHCGQRATVSPSFGGSLVLLCFEVLSEAGHSVLRPGSILLITVDFFLAGVTSGKISLSLGWRERQADHSGIASVKLTPSCVH